MATYNYKPGLGNVASYQASGTPFVTGGINAVHGPIKVSFPSVTSWIIVGNVGATSDCRIGFSSDGVKGTNYILLDAGAVWPQPALQVKVTELWLSGSDSVDVMAGLTGIDMAYINNPVLSPSGSNWSGSLHALVG